MKFYTSFLLILISILTAFSFRTSKYTIQSDEISPKNLIRCIDTLLITKPGKLFYKNLAALNVTAKKDGIANKCDVRGQFEYYGIANACNSGTTDYYRYKNFEWLKYKTSVYADSAFDKLIWIVCNKFNGEFNTFHYVFSKGGATYIKKGNWILLHRAECSQWMTHANLDQELLRIIYKQDTIAAKTNCLYSKCGWNRPVLYKNCLQ